MGNGQRYSILTINGGSSSIKLAVFKKENELIPLLSGKIERIGLKDATFSVKEGDHSTKVDADISSFDAATHSLVEWLNGQSWFDDVKVIGHRIVHGMQHTASATVDDALLKELDSIISYDPDHLPAEIGVIKAIQEKYPRLRQVACFDTAFHAGIPAVAATWAIPRQYREEGVRRYGFHGISYSYLLQQLQVIDSAVASGKVIFAHLGNGASLAAVKEGGCIDTSMGFTPAGGVVMSTRSGDLDPGVAWYCMQKGMSATEFNEMINNRSGLLAVSGISPDIRDLLEKEKDNADAALAIELFCYQVKKFIGAYAAALGGLDALVFSGGIGENASIIRARICKELAFVGIELDEAANDRNEPVISGKTGRTKVFVIRTDEERMIAQESAAIYETEVKQS